MIDGAWRCLRTVNRIQIYRGYSSIRNLPKVGQGNSDGLKLNRFAEMYKRKADVQRKPWHQGKREQREAGDNTVSRSLAPAKPHGDGISQQQRQEEYSKIRRKLNDQHKQHKQAKESENAKRNGAKQNGQTKRGSSETSSVNSLKGPNKQSMEKAKIKISIPTFVSVSNLSTILNVPLSTFLSRLESLGFEEMTHNFILDKENAALIADEFGYEVTMNDDTGLDLFSHPEEPSKLKPRPPIVTIMGHVDHGKTTILDFLRKSAIIEGEFGGITQHIGAFSVITPVSKKKITFLDTPGHAAFLSMRERGANVTDIVILVVAADDSVMPQTIEAIKHAKKLGVPIIVAINKCDKPGIKISKVLSDLARYEVDIEDYGGETQTVQVSGKTGKNMDKLEEAVITLSELSEFQAEFTGIPAEGRVIESEVKTGLGNVSTVLVKRGTIKVGSFLVAGTTFCKVRGMKDEFGKPLKQAGPSTPVQIWGWKELPQAGDEILEAKLEQICKKVVQNRASRQKEVQAFKDIETINAKRKQEIKDLQRQEKINELKLAGLDASELMESEEDKKAEMVNYIVRCDVFGSAEAVKDSLDGLGNDEVQARIISHEAGVPTESDLDMANALGAEILCFNVKVPKNIQIKADRMNVKIYEQNVIYRLIEEVTAKLTSLLKPHIEIKVISEAELKSIFKVTAKNKSIVKIAGCKVTSGTLKRSSKVRVRRGDEIIFKGSLSSLKFVKQDISEATKGNECGLSFEGWDKFEEGDFIEAYEEIEIPRYL